jgi:hypothetical protein
MALLRHEKVKPFGGKICSNNRQEGLNPALFYTGANPKTFEFTATTPALYVIGYSVFY